MEGSASDVVVVLVNVIHVVSLSFMALTSAAMAETMKNTPT